MPGEELSDTVKHIAKLYSDGVPSHGHGSVSVSSEATAKSCVEEARAASKKDKCPILAKIAKGRLDYADEPVFAALNECGLAMNIPVQKLQLDPSFNYPAFHPRDILQTIAEAGHLHKVLGVPVAFSDDVFPKFWQRFRSQFPDHDLFHQEGIDFRTLVPCFLHGDGGRTYRKDSILVCSMLPALGQGTRYAPVDLQPLPEQRRGTKRPTPGSHGIEFEEGVNLVGRSFANRFLYIAIKTEFYKDKPRRFRNIIRMWGQYMRELFDTGFNFKGVTWRFAVLGLAGDQPFLREAGNHTRSFGNVQKAATSKQFLPGICWLCAAGRTRGPPFDDCDILAAEWTRTVGSHNLLPWTRPGPLIEHLPQNPDDLAAFYLPDIFHIWHMGVGKDVAASILLHFLRDVCGASSIDAGFAALNSELAQYKAEHRSEKCHCGKRLSKELLGYGGTATYPMGHWSKGADTTFFMKFAQNLMEKQLQQRPELANDSLVKTMVRACKAIGFVLHTMFHAGFWFTPQEAEGVISAGHEFGLCYVKLAEICLQRGLCLFKLKPKLHMLCHFFHTSMLQFRRNQDAVVNFLAYSTFQCEDFVGRVSRLSRRVSPKVHGDKIYNRYLVALKRALDE